MTTSGLYVKLSIMLFRFLVVTAFLIFSSARAFAVADFSGHWIASSGKVSSNLPGFGADCSKVEIVIEQSQEALVTKSYQAECQLFSTHWGPVREEIQGNQVLEEGEVVGTISDDTLMTTSTSGTVQYAFNLQLVRDAEGNTVLRSYYGTRNFIGAIAVEAELRKAGE